jgi:tungstate transport system substrate-binding protein
VLRYVYQYITSCLSRFELNSRKIALSILVLIIVIAGSFLAYTYFLQPQAPPEKQVLILSTTTSTYDTGLLDYLLPYFEQQYNVQVNVLSKGTGEALQIAQRGDADVVLVHSRTLEMPFVDGGYGVHRVGVMYNDFIIIGPKEDPAGIVGTTNASYAFQRILLAGQAGNTTFISRADKSGTNTKELSIWSAINIKPSNKTYTWYLEAGAGMGTVLHLTNEKKAYTLTDRGTWLKFQDQLTNLEVMTQGDKTLLNPYAVIPVNGTMFPQRNYRMAVTFAKFLISNDGQQLIANYKVVNQSLFIPIARNFTAAQSLGFPTQEQEVAWYDSVDLATLVFVMQVALPEKRNTIQDY